MPGIRARRAFTLLELILVIALVGLLMAYAWPDLDSTSRSQRLQESAARMRALIAMCRAEAMNEARRYRIEIHPDGSVRAQEQVDPLFAPHLYNPVQALWANTGILLDDVWVSDVQLLADGPPPIMIVDDKLQLPTTDIEPVPVQDLEAPLQIDFEADGSCPSLRWVLRAADGRGLLMTLDGRLGRVKLEDWPALSPGDIERPAPLPVEEVTIYNPEDFKERP